MLESLFNKIAGLKACNFINKRLQHRVFSVNIAKFLRIPILKNICEPLLLIVFLRPLIDEVRVWLYLGEANVVIFDESV